MNHHILKTVPGKVRFIFKKKKKRFSTKGIKNSNNNEIM